MVANTRAEASSQQHASDQYRQAEQLLWDRFGLRPTERFVTIQEPGARLRVVERGQGEPVLFVPGTGGTGPC